MNPRDDDAVPRRAGPTGGQEERARLHPGLRIATWVLLVPSVLLTLVYFKGIVDPGPGRTSSEFATGGMPVFFITAVLAWFAFRKPGGEG